jgi:hypothetical protein
MYLLGDPGSVPLNRLRYAENCRFRGGTITDRHSAEDVVDGTAYEALLDVTTSEISGIYDWTLGSTSKLVCLLEGCTLGGGAYWMVMVWNFAAKNALVQRVLFPAATLCSMAVFDGDLYVGVDSTLYVVPLEEPGGDVQTASSLHARSDIVKTFSGFSIRSMCEYDGKLFIGLDAGAGASKIATWDGLTLRDGTNGTTADKTAIDPPSKMVKFRDQLAIGFTTATGLIFRDAAGAYTSSGGTAITVEMVSYRDNLYVASGGITLTKWDGAAVSAARTFGAGNLFWSVAEFNGYLYYGWQSSTNHAIVGRMTSGGVFTDTIKDLTGLVATLIKPRVMTEYLGGLAVGVNKAGDRNAMGFFSIGTDTARFRYATFPDGGNGGIVDLKVA